MAESSKLDRFCRTSISIVFVALFAIGQCMAQNPGGAPAQSGSEELNEPDSPAAINQQPDANVVGSAAAQAKKANSMMDRVKDRGRKFPARDNWTIIKIVKHVSGVFGGLEQGAGPGFGIELTTADSIPEIEFRATMLTSNKLYSRFEGEAYIPKIIDEKTHADFWYGYLRRTEDYFFGIGASAPMSARTNFDVERRAANGGLFRDFTENIQAGIYISYINSDAYGGRAASRPPWIPSSRAIHRCACLSMDPRTSFRFQSNCLWTIWRI